MNTELKKKIIAKLHTMAKVAAVEKNDALEVARFDRAEMYHYRCEACISVAGFVDNRLSVDEPEDAMRRVVLALTQNNHSLSVENPRHIEMAKVLSLVLEWMLDPEML